MKYPNAREALAAKYRQRYANRNRQAGREGDDATRARRLEEIATKLRQGAATIKDRDQ